VYISSPQMGSSPVVAKTTMATSSRVCPQLLVWDRLGDLVVEDEHVDL
jgi:hypothetical protein